MTEVEASINRMLHPPYDEGMLTHRDFFGQDWSVVYETPERLLMMWTKGPWAEHLVWLTRAEGYIVEAKRVPEGDVDRVFDEFGRHLHGTERTHLEHALQVGVPHPQTLNAFLKENRWDRTFLNYQEAGSDGSTIWYQAIRMPTRAAEVLIVVTVGKEGLLQECSILEGEVARRKDKWCIAQRYKQRQRNA